MFYDRFLELCEDRGLKPKQAVSEMKLSNSIATAWKKRGLTPKGDTLAKISKYFDVPISFLLERTPFDYWEKINADRTGFLQYAKFNDALIKKRWGVDIRSPNDAPLNNFLHFLSESIHLAYLNADGSWDILVDRFYAPNDEKVLVPEGERSLDQQLSGIDFALSGEIHDLTDAEKQDILDYIRFKKSQRGGGSK